MKLITLDAVERNYFLNNFYRQIQLRDLEETDHYNFDFWQYCEYLKQEGYRII